MVDGVRQTLQVLGLLRSEKIEWLLDLIVVVLVVWKEALFAVADRSEREEDEHTTCGGHEDHHHMSGRPRLAVVLELGQLNRFVHRLLDRVHVGGVRLAAGRVGWCLIGWRSIGNRNGAIRSLPSLHAVTRVQIRTDLGRQKMLINHFDRFASCFHHVPIIISLKFLKIQRDRRLFLYSTQLSHRYLVSGKV